MVHGGQTAEKRWKAPAELWDRLKPLAREMRAKPTAFEDALWEQLRDRRLSDMKFRRQHAIERFVVDFYCGAARIVIEVDGHIHDYTREQDRTRQEFLEQQGLRVLRFTNDEVRTNIAEVLRMIEAQLKTPTERTPSPPGGEGRGEVSR
jgi:very-short-patch-repair endonuclease